MSSLDKPRSKFDRNIFELQPLEVRKLLTTAAIESGALLHIIGTANAETITVNTLSNGKVSVSGVTTQFTPGTQFTQILIEAGGGNDTVQITNNVTYNTATLTGNTGNDTIFGGKGADQVFGAAGNDDLHGGVGNDYMDGNSGNDNMIGDDGFDITNYSDRTTAVRVTLDGAANDGEVSLGEVDNVQTEEVLGGAGNDTLTGSNTTGDYLSGGGGADAITGNGGNDELTGGSGGDNLQGGEGDDYLHAQNNDRDTVNGGTGPGTTDHDLAEIDGLDVSALTAGGLNADIPNQGVISTNPADLDTTYGTGGKVSDQTLTFQPSAEAIDSQGRVVYVGTIFNHQNAGGGYGAEMVAVRYDANGNRDSTFGSGGTELIDFTPNGGVGNGYNSDDEALGVVIGPDDSIFVIGETTPIFQFSPDTAVAKLNPSGNLDPTFGTGGTASTDTSGDGFADSGFTGAVTSSGGIVVLGSAGSEGTSPRLSRFSSLGVPDDGFDPAIDLSNPNAVALQTFPSDEGAQRIVIAGANTNGSWELERFLSSGTADSSFGTAGVVTHDFGGTPFTSGVGGMTVDGNQDIVVAGYIGNIPSGLTTGVPTPTDQTYEAVLAKFAASDGAFVAAASHNGVSAGNSAFFNGVTVDAQGRYVVVGEEDSDSSADFLVARVNANMTPDNTFGLGGVTTTDFTPAGGPDYSDAATPVRVLSNGKIVAAGTSFFSIPQTESSALIPAIARYVGNNPVGGEGDVTQVEDFSNYGELHQQPPTPRMQAIFNRISDIAKNNLLWQPDDQGVVRVELDDKNNTVKFSTITTGDGKLNVVMNVDGILSEYYDPTTTKEIQIYAKGGNDVILAGNSITIPLLVDAGAGNDIVTGGAGNDVIFGGTGIDLVNGNAGNDAILGGPGIDGLYGDGGRDLVIGGADPDAIAGGADDDIEIAGTTSYEADTAANVASLKAIIAEWGSVTTSYANRINHIRSGIGGLNGSNVLRGPGTGQTVFNDGVIDVLTNDAGQDWFFAHTTGNALVKDQILFGLGGETKDEI